ncbi:MAG: acetolactate synthase small subunit [Calditrichota bacterium]|jgi:acetolactate synthase I/III small subunit
MKHTLSLLVENNPGTLSRIAGQLTGRGFDIDSIAVGHAEESGTTRITLVTHGDDSIIEQINKQLNKIVDVIKVTDLTESNFVNRELALIKINALPDHRLEIMQIVDVFRGKIVDISPKSLTIEVTGIEDKIDALISMLRSFGIREIARTGPVALKREYYESQERQS